jgi:predicted HTH transcriptional regulator
LGDICLSGGIIDGCGRGMLKIINSSKEAGLAKPAIKDQHGGLLVRLFKGIR